VGALRGLRALDIVDPVQVRVAPDGLRAHAFFHRELTKTSLRETVNETALWRAIGTDNSSFGTMLHNKYRRARALTELPNAVSQPVP
jgi:hypothetical protein